MAALEEEEFRRVLTLTQAKQAEEAQQVTAVRSVCMLRPLCAVGCMPACIPVIALAVPGSYGTCWPPTNSPFLGNTVRRPPCRPQ